MGTWQDKERKMAFRLQRGLQQDNGYWLWFYRPPSGATGVDLGGLRTEPQFPLSISLVLGLVVDNTIPLKEST